MRERQPQLSVVIPVFNNWWLTRRCLTALAHLAQHGELRFETIVVDNASSDATPKEIHAFDVRYVRHDVNRNFAGGCNAGASAARAPYVLFLNNDATPLGDPFPALLRAFHDGRVVIAGGKLLFEDGVVQSAGMTLLPNAHWWLSHRNLPEATTSEGEVRSVAAVSGAAMVVRREWFLDRGGFDEAYVNGFEDVDLCMRALRDGRSISYVESARFSHLESATPGRFDFELQNERLFYRRWSRLLQAIPRTVRTNVGTIEICAGDTVNLAKRFALDDLCEALRALGHPVYFGTTPVLQRVTERWLRRGRFEWFSRPGRAAAVAVTAASAAVHYTLRGRLRGDAPWLPFAAETRVQTFALAPSEARSGCVAIAGKLGGSAIAQALRESGHRAVKLGGPDGATFYSTSPQRVDAFVVDELPDEIGYVVVLAALAGIPIVCAPGSAVARMFSNEVVTHVDEAAAGRVVEALARPTELRARAEEARAEARRRFSPRRAAMRAIDLLSAATFGPERPGARRADSPI